MGGVQCWGRNNYGQLGNNSTTDSTTPVQVQGLTSGVTAISAGDSHTCALVGGAVQCWGSNGSGCLGNNSTTDSHSPVHVQGIASGATAMTSGGSHTCALVSGGVQCWGYNANGQVGNTCVFCYAPVQVQGISSGATGTSAGTFFSCATVGGAVRCWGQNNYGQLGNGSTSDSQTPVQVENITSDAIAVGAGNYHACALVGGGIQCWGDNTLGKLGSSSTTANIPTAIQVQGITTNVKSVVGGYTHTCAQVNGSIQCWGGNGSGQLGNNTTNPSSTTPPGQVYGITSGVTGLDAGDYHTCAVVNGSAQCWGENTHGQLGNNSTISSAVPVSVSFQ